MRAVILFLAVLFGVPALAADDPFAGMAELTQVKGRYTVGPWQGAMLGGENCQLANTETLGGVEFSLSAIRARPDRSIQLGAEFLHDPRIREVTLQLDRQEPRKISFAKSRFGLFYNATPEHLAELAQARFATYRIGTGSITFDLRGFDRAYALFEQCLTDTLPADLPNEPLAEMQPHRLPGIGNWQITDLNFQDSPYARLASLDGSGDFALGLWVHNRAQYVLALSATRGDLPDFPFPHQAVLTLDGSRKITLPFIPQADGILISLPLTQLRQVAAARRLEVVAGGLTAVYDISNFGAVAQAIQFTD